MWKTYNEILLLATSQWACHNLFIYWFFIHYPSLWFCCGGLYGWVAIIQPICDWIGRCSVSALMKGHHVIIIGRDIFSPSVSLSVHIDEAFCFSQEVALWWKMLVTLSQIITNQVQPLSFPIKSIWISVFSGAACNFLPFITFSTMLFIDPTGALHWEISVAGVCWSYCGTGACLELSGVLVYPLLNQLWCRDKQRQWDRRTETTGVFNHLMVWWRFDMRPYEQLRTFLLSLIPADN